MVTDLQSVNGVSATSRRRDGTPGCFGGRQAFTLVEIVIALTVVTIIVAGSIPTFRGLRDEQMAREPVQALARLSKEARLRACLLYTSPSPRDRTRSRMPSSA